VYKADLHVHTTASDGRFSPEEIVQKAAELGLTTIAIADHDTVDGIVPATEAAKSFPGLRIIPSVEINTDVPHGEAHILGYFVDYSNNELLSALERLRNFRKERAQKMVVRLKEMGIKIEWQRVQEIAGGGAMGRPHLARAMLEKGYIKSFREAFDRYIGREGPAYVERDKIDPVEAVRLVLWADGLPVLAHPLILRDPEAMIISLKMVGLVGIEAYYGEYSAGEISGLLGLAGSYNLLTTGGSDYHGTDSGGEIMMGDVQIPAEAVERLISLAKQRGLKSDRS